MSTRPYTPLPSIPPPSTSLLRNRPSASSIANPISLNNPILPATPGAAGVFTPPDLPVTFDGDLAAYGEKVRVTSELAVALEMSNSGNKGLYFKSSANRAAASKGSAMYTTAMAKVVGMTNDALRAEEVVEARYATADFKVAVERYKAQVNGVVGKFEASADAYVQAQNIIYDADVTATKLQSLGIEKAVGFESDFALDIRKTENRVFMDQVSKEQAIASRDVKGYSSIRTDEFKQIKNQEAMGYEHGRNNEARSYDATVNASAVLDVATDLSTIKINSATTEATARIDGATKVSNARITATDNSSQARITTLGLKDNVDTEVTSNESAATLASTDVRYLASEQAAQSEGDTEIAEMGKVAIALQANKRDQYNATAQGMRDKMEARTAEMYDSIAARTSLIGARIDTARSTTNIGANARIEAARQEANAHEMAIPIITAGITTAVGAGVGFMERALQERLSFVKSSNEVLYSAESDALGSETTAHIDSIRITGTAEQKAATDRAKATIDGGEVRNNATHAATIKMKEAMVQAIRTRMNNSATRADNINRLVEGVTNSTNNSRLDADKATNEAQLGSQKIIDAADINALKALNDTRISTASAITDAELALKERENAARIEADGLQYAAQAYAMGKTAAANAYSSALGSAARRITQLNATTADSYGTTLLIRQGLMAEERAALFNFIKAAETQEVRRDIISYSKKLGSGGAAA